MLASAQPVSITYTANHKAPVTGRTRLKMNLLEKSKSVLPVLNVVWKVWLLVTLIWIGQSLRVIADSTFAGDSLPGATDPASQDRSDGIDKQACPRDAPVADQLRDQSQRQVGV